jgi:hypothetical protein
VRLLDFARERCIHDPALVVLLAVGGVTIFLAYASIARDIRWVAARLRKVPFPALWWLFCAFIFACGCSHLVASIVLFRPAFYLEAVIILVTASISVVAALVVHRSRRPLLSSLEATEDLRAAVSESLQAGE